MNVEALPVLPPLLVQQHKDNVARILCAFQATSVFVPRLGNESEKEYAARVAVAEAESEAGNTKRLAEVLRAYFHVCNIGP